MSKHNWNIHAFHLYHAISHKDQTYPNCKKIDKVYVLYIAENSFCHILQNLLSHRMELM